MAQLPEAAQQILKVHAQFIHAVVNALRNRALMPQLMSMLDEAEKHGWGKLVATLRQVADGKRGPEVMLGLDDEDRVIAEAVLRGIDNPETLPSLDAKPEASAAAPGLAAMIQAAAHGDVKAFAVLADMAEQMLKAGGDMARLGGNMRRLIDGERDADLLTKGMGPLGRQLVLSLLDELGRMRLQ